MNSIVLVIVGALVLILGYRLYGCFIAAKVLALDETRKVPSLYNSPWGTFTVGVTIPIAILVDIYLRFIIMAMLVVIMFERIKSWRKNWNKNFDSDSSPPAHP